MAQNNHDWQSLVELSGLMVSEPVLREAFPNGPLALENKLSRKFRTEYERWRGAEDKREKDADRADRARTHWLDFILRTLLDYGVDLRNKMDLPPQLKIDLTEFEQTLSPNRFVVDEQGDPQILIYLADGRLDRPEQKTGRWKASPFTKLDRLLRDTKVQLGLLTNAQDWRLVYAAPGLPTSYITWTANSWNDERLTLQSFVMLLNNPAKLLEMASESQSRQADVTDKLGNQVLTALSIFVRQLDRADVDADNVLLEGLTSEAMYEMALFVMMRLVFIFYAEENGLLPHGEVFYDEAYGLTYLWNKLDREYLTDKDALAQREDAWPRLLATFRLIHAGCAHPDLSMAAYGGALFDPERFPVLEDPRLRIKNIAIWRMLRRLTTAESSDGRQRVSYRALQVEQLGYVYENLLGFTIKEATEMMMTPEGTLEAYPVTGFVEALEADGEDGIYEYYKGINDLHWTQTRKFAEEIAKRAESNPDDIEWVFYPITEGEYIEPGQRYVAFQMGTRKRGGIFYTPPQLTSFLVEQALKPQVYDDPDNEQGIRDSRHILSLTVCDPAMGSGAFLVQAVRYLGDRLVESWTAATTQTDDVLVMPYAELDGKTRENLGPIPIDENEAKAWAYRLVAERCIYGVDLNRLASELAKLSIWLVSLAKDKPFTFLDHRLQHGNSLIGASFFKETTIEWTLKDKDPVTGEKIKREETVRQMEFIPDAALKAYKDADKDYTKSANARIKGNQKAQLAIANGQMGLFGNISVEEALSRLIERKATLEEPTQQAGDYASKSALLREVLGQGDYPLLKEIADLWCSVWFWPRDIAEHGMPPTTEEYHDTVQVILDIAPKDMFGTMNLATQPERIQQIRATTEQVAKREHFFHWELEFPTIFTRENPGCDVVLGNPPWETVKPNSQEFFESYEPNFRSYSKQEAIHVAETLMHKSPHIMDEWELYTTSLESQSVYYKSDVSYHYQGKGDINTYKLFTEQFYWLARFSGLFSLIIPSGIYSDLGAKELRELLFDLASIKTMLSFQNTNEIFKIHRQYVFVLLTVEKSDKTSQFRTAFLLENIDDLSNLSSLSLTVSPKDIKKFSPDSLSIMEFQTQADVDVMTKIFASYPLLDENNLDSWNVNFYREFDMTNYSHLLNETGLGLPLYEGKMVAQYDGFYSTPSYWVDVNAWKDLSSKLSKTFNTPRLVHRRISNRQNARTLICAYVPPKSVCETNATSIIFDGSKHEEMFLLAVLNSFVLDSVIRKKVYATLNMFYMYQLPVPRLQAGNPYFDMLVPRASKLTCTTHHFADLWQEVMDEEWDESKGATDEAERQQLRNEIDAIVAHLYGLSRDDFEHILGTFPLVFPDTDEGQAKKSRLLDEYDKWADTVKDWSRA